MAARNRQRGIGWSDNVRSRIQAGNLVTRLNGIASGAVKGDPKMLAVQVNAARVLLAKALPDLSSVTMENGGDGPFRVIIEKLPPK